MHRTDHDLNHPPFAEPWQARVFAAAILAADALELPWDAFRDRLKSAIAAEPARPYFACWMDALEAMVSAP